MKVKVCSSCDTVKPIDEFSVRTDGVRDGRRAHCTECRAKKWEDLSYERRTYNKRKKFGLSYADYMAMRARQDDKCAICGDSETERIQVSTGMERELSVDHDHTTGVIRELLCGRCNRAIGLMMDNPDRLRNAAEYVERHASPH